MARSTAARKYQITINNPQKHGFTHEHIKGLTSVRNALEIPHLLMGKAKKKNAKPNRI